MDSRRKRFDTRELLAGLIIVLCIITLGVHKVDTTTQMYIQTVISTLTGWMFRGRSKKRDD